MSSAPETCWTLIHAATTGDAAARRQFTERYLPAVRAYLRARWQGPALAAEVDDAVQEVFLDCFREGGAFARLDPGRGAGFRAFFYGVVRNVALHVETRRARDLAKRGDSTFHPEDLAAREASLSRCFDRELARAVVRDAAALHRKNAQAGGAAALKRVELLQLRFHEGKPIREIAQLWDIDPARLHTEYAQARKEFLDALREVVGLSERCSRERLAEECARIIELLG